MAINGLRDTSNFVANQRPENWREGVLLSYPNGKAPLLALTSLMKKRTVDDPVFHWWEKQLDDRRVALGANVANAAAGTVTALTLVAGALAFKSGDVLKAEQSGEIVRVYSDPTSDTVLQVHRGFAASTPAAITYAGAGVNPNLICIGSAFEEGSLAPTGVNFDPVEKSNYTQIFRSTLEATRTALKTRLRTGDAIKEAKREALEYISVDIERSMWFGKKSASTLNGKPIRTMNGILEQIDSGNIFTASGSTGDSMATFEEWIRQVFSYGSNEKIAFCGNRAALALNQIVRKNSQFQIQSGIKEYGMDVSRFMTPFGTLVVKTHPLFNQMGGGTTGGTAYYGVDSWMFILDAGDLTYVNLTDSDLNYQPDLQSNGMDGMKSGYLGELSMELHHVEHHFLIKNFSKGIVDA